MYYFCKGVFIIQKKCYPPPLAAKNVCFAIAIFHQCPSVGSAFFERISIFNVLVCFLVVKTVISWQIIVTNVYFCTGRWFHNCFTIFCCVFSYCKNYCLTALLKNLDSSTSSTLSLTTLCRIVLQATVTLLVEIFDCMMQHTNMIQHTYLYLLSMVLFIKNLVLCNLRQAKKKPKVFWHQKIENTNCTVLVDVKIRSIVLEIFAIENESFNLHEFISRFYDVGKGTPSTISSSE